MFDKYITPKGRLSCKQPQEVKNQWYIQKFQEVHGDIYDYSKIIYVGQLGKVEIVCEVHGSFFQTPSTHLKGHGCPLCHRNAKKDTRQCVEDFKNVHGSLYDYSQVVYLGQLDKVEIRCKEHGEFFQTPASHLAGRGCPKCQGNIRKDTRYCLEQFIKIHGNSYDYSKVEYKTANTKVEILCKEHGKFLQTPSNHLRGKGCPKCWVSNQNILYLLRCTDTSLIKIGITNNLNKRISSIGSNLEYLYHITLENPRQLEKGLHEQYQQYQVFNPNVRSGGTEFFQLSEIQLEYLINRIKEEE